ncbi:hypothetical protein C8Q77DRAFT_1156458 [Trametes polyzona]|nr:hypothetical protein C8Q77DRAFT_1156458 [Trametes polyzona]
MSVAPPSPTVGALLIGGIVGPMLHGLTCSQAFMYYGRSEKDPTFMRLYVFSIWCIDSLNVFLVGHTLYYYFITSYGNPGVFQTPAWSLVLLVLVTSLVSFMVRGMFIKGIWHLSHENPILTGGLGLLSVFDLVCGLILTVKGFNVKGGGMESLKISLYLNFASAVLADAAVAVTLLNLLRGSKTGNPRRDSALGRLMLYTVNTGLLTAADATVALLTYAIMPHNFVFLTPYMILSHFYTNALFASLNARTFGKNGDHVVSVNLSMSAVSPPRYTANATSAGSHGGPELSLQIPIQTVIETRVDGSQHGSQSDNEDIKHYSLAKAM